MPLSPADWQAQFIAGACLLCAPLGVAYAAYIHRTTGRTFDALAVIITVFSVAAFGWFYGRVTLHWWPPVAGSAALRPSLVVLVLAIIALLTIFTINSKRTADVLTVQAQVLALKEQALVELARYGRMQQEALTAAQEAAARAQEFAELQQRFVANINHEIRTPLSAILGYSEPDFARMEYMPRIHRAGRRLDDLARTLNATKRLELGGELHLENVSLAACVREALDYVQWRVEGSDIRIVRNLQEAAVWVSPTPVVLMIGNLLHNAIKFNEKGGTVEVSAFAADNGGVLRVQDTGIGIPAGRLDDIFRPYVQLDGGNNRSRDGVGIGLYFVKLVVEEHNGRITVTSVPGEGSTFEVWLPGAPPEGQP